MARCLARARFIIGAWVVLLALAIVLPASAQRNPDGSVNPTASAVKEQQLLLVDGGRGRIDRRRLLRRSRHGNGEQKSER